jgi:hypothetical protein
MSRILLYFSFICTVGLVSCARTHDERLFVVEKDDLFGYISENGDTIIPCIYPLAYTDTINRIGFVADGNGKIVCLDRKGNKLFDVFKYDNGPDYPQEGLFRIIDGEGNVGFADTLGKVIIPPTYKFAFPFKDGKAKVTHGGRSVRSGEHTVWESSSWILIDNPLLSKVN